MIKYDPTLTTPIEVLLNVNVLRFHHTSSEGGLLVILLSDPG